MKPDCRNDCLEPFLFPKRPFNRPGLLHIDYRIGTYSDFREAIFKALNKDPLLAKWTYRKEDDPGIALLEGASILGDILTFYQELYANEAYLRTAQWRESISDLVRLLGYRLSPGVGGKGSFAFEVRGDRPVIIPAGFPVKAQLEELDDQAEFETLHETTAYPWLSKFNLYRRLFTPRITQETKEFYIFSPDQYQDPIALKEGDRLMIGDPFPTANPTRLINTEIVIVDKISELHGRKIFKIKGALKRTGSALQIAGFKLGRSFKHFGHNAPSKMISISDGVAIESSLSYERQLNSTPPGIPLSFDLGSRAFPLEEEVDDLALGTTLICETVLRRESGDRRFYTPVTFPLIRTIEEIRKISYTFGSLTGSPTLIILDSILTTTTDPDFDTFHPESHTYDRIDIREIQFHEALSPLIRLRAGVQETTTIKGNELFFNGTNDHAQILKDRKLGFVKPDSDAIEANVLSVQELSSDFINRLWQITLDREVNYNDFPNQNPITTVFGNLAETTQGKTEKEKVLGNGDNRQTFHTFKLPKSPLTYHNAADETPSEVPELQIYVNDSLWQRVPSFFNRGPGEQIYIVREDAENNSWVQFGDGNTGSRLQSGVKNIVAQYRTGTGAYGVLKEETTVQAGGKVKHLDKIQLPGLISGGSEPEDEENAREAAPGKIQSLDRLVSLSDFESETLGIAGVSKASASWDLIDNVPGVVITVLMETGRDNEIEEIRRILLHYNRCRGPQRFPIKVYQGRLKYLFLDIVYGLDPSYKKEIIAKAIKEALGVTGDEGNVFDGARGLFGLRKRTFGQNEYASRIIGTVQNVDGVVWAKVTALGALGEAADPENFILPVEPKTNNQVVACDNRHILSLYTKHFQINAAVVETGEAC